MAFLAAAAAGQVKPEELTEMGRISVRMGVGPEVVEQTLQAAAHPFD